jgi:hypothetical protein
MSGRGRLNLELAPAGVQLAAGASCSLDTFSVFVYAILSTSVFLRVPRAILHGFLKIVSPLFEI